MREKIQMRLRKLRRLSLLCECEKGETPAKGHYQFLQLLSRPAVPEPGVQSIPEALSLSSIHTVSSSAPQSTPAQVTEPARPTVRLQAVTGAVLFYTSIH